MLPRVTVRSGKKGPCPETGETEDQYFPDLLLWFPADFSYCKILVTVQPGLRIYRFRFASVRKCGKVYLITLVSRDYLLGKTKGEKS